MPDDDDSLADELAIAWGTLAAIADREPETYVSNRRGPTPISEMDPQWAEHAAHAVEEGRRPANSPRVVPPLERQART